MLYRPRSRYRLWVRSQSSGHDWPGGPVWSLAAEVRQMRCSKADLEPEPCRQPCLVHRALCLVPARPSQFQIKTKEGRARRVDLQKPPPAWFHLMSPEARGSGRGQAKSSLGKAKSVPTDTSPVQSGVWSLESRVFCLESVPSVLSCPSPSSLAGHPSHAYLTGLSGSAD